MKLLVSAAVALSTAVASPALAQAPSDAARGQLKALIENVTQANGWRYNARDSAGNLMDTAKIIADPAGGYFAVYHTYVGGIPIVKLSTSTDVLNWTHRRDLGTRASQATIKVASNGGIVVAWEQEPSNHLSFRYYSNRANLLNGVVARTFEAPRLLSSCAEGTPNIYSITLSPDINNSTIDVGAHYWWNCDRDRQQRGTLRNFNSWTASAQGNFDNALLHWGVGGNIGDRDGASNFGGYNFGVIEGQFAKGDFGTWRSFLYDYQTGNAEQLAIRTHGGSAAFANPTHTLLTVGGQQASVVTLFVPSEGAAPGEAGELIYYRYTQGSSSTIVVDNGTSAFSTGGAWVASTSTPGYFGSNYLTDGSANVDTGKWAKWKPTFPTTRNYAVHARWTAGSNRPASVRYRIAHQGVVTDVWQNQRVNGGTWVNLGTYAFGAGNSESNRVTLDAGSASGFVIADAVQFVPN